MIITLISLLTFCTYMGAILAKYGIPASVSETFYLLPKGKRWLFTAFCWAVSIVIAPWLDATPENWQFLAFLSVAGLCFVGTAAQFKDDFVARVHYAGAGLCAVASQLWIFIVTGLWWLSLVCLLTAGTACFVLWRRASRKAGRPQFANVVFWAEMWAFVSLFASILIYKMGGA
ncbi:MAG: hypothetical protein LBV18_04085 [Alistipes sp.]|jgi:hypothetical protein|nr:hypothetical protein [Alistipes sp.]